MPSAGRSAIFGAAILAACSAVLTQSRTLTDPARPSTLDGKSPFLKAHMKNGDAYILSAWSIDTVRKTASGTGDELDITRNVVRSGPQVVPLDSVVLFETNRVEPHGSVTAMTLMTGASLAMTVYCATNPKACFGSCPTFYVDDGTRSVLQAEGFSASVSPALEAADIDALYRARPSGQTFKITMKNEALETHAVRWVNVLAAAHAPGERVFATDAGEFWRASSVVAPTRCSASEGDCRAAVVALDDVERFSGADSANLAAREFIYLEFPAMQSGRAGLVIGSRQTLLSTFLFYQGLAYLGHSAGDWMAALQRGLPGVRAQSQAIQRAMGGIEVEALDSLGRWQAVGESNEAGPLAVDVRLVVLPAVRGGGATRLRLGLARGEWRIDYLALAELSGRVTPARIEPTEVRRGGDADPQALAALTDSARLLTALPGDEYTLVYRLPADAPHFDLFLESRGYYLEWMRDEWMAEENPAAAAMMFLNPGEALRVLAPAFKRREASMESAFWRSRYARP